MSCPQCNNDEISPSGVCLVCGYHVAEPQPHAGMGVSGVIEIDYAGRTQNPEGSRVEIPQWRQELAERLKAIKQKRDSLGVPVSQPAAPVLPTSPPERVRKRPPVRIAERPAAPVPRQKTLQPLEPEPFTVQPQRKPADPGEIQKIIDNAVFRQTVPAGASAPEEAVLTRAADELGEGKLILLSRTLSGLVDLIFIIFCVGALIIAADFFSGILVLDAFSVFDFSLLFLLTYFLYSLFFLAATNQTIGMMITSLRVVGIDQARPPAGRILGRCLGYVLSLFGLGIGLLWSLFDRESLCFHDRISHTRVVRI